MKKKIVLGIIFMTMVFICSACGKNNTEKKSLDEEVVTEIIGTTEEEENTDTSEEVTEADTEENASSEEGTELAGAYDSQVEQVLAQMTLREKICQMLFVNPESITGVSTVIAAGEATKQALEKYPVGGIMYSKPNLESKDQVATMIANVQDYADIDLFIAADEEGGTVNRLMDTLGTTYINSMYTYKDQGTTVAHDNAATIAGDMSALGFNLDFAPVADVWSNSANTVIGKRAYSDDFGQAAELIPYAVQGFHDGGVLCTLKHFPGHGNTAEDSHYSSAYVNKTKDELEADEFLPFEAGIEAGADFVMVGHLIVPDIDELPATLSEKIVTGILREELGFSGVIITDSLEMSSVADNYSASDIAVMAVKAGIDMLLEPKDIDATIDALMTAVEEGTITEERINESVRRILQTKLDNGISIGVE
jgi:beta-N-acetylhexosaminidase